MILIVVGRGIQFLLLFASIKISTTLLAPTEMAKLYLIASLYSLQALLFISPVGNFINRRMHGWNRAGRVQNYLKYFWLYLLAIVLCTLVLLELLINVNLVQLHIGTKWIPLIVAGTLLFTTMNQSVIPWLNLLGYLEWFVGLTLATATVSLVASLLLVKLFEPRAEYWQCGILFGQLLAAGLGWRIFYSRLNARSLSREPTNLQVSALLKFALPICIAVGLGWVQTQSYRFMMESSLGLHALGLFAAGYGISAGVIAAFESVITTYLQPMFYKQVSNDNVVEQSKAWIEYAGAIFPSLMLVGLVIIATGPELTRVLLGAEYRSSSQFIGWGVVAELARVASGVYGIVAHARMKTRLLLAPSLVGAFLSVALIWWLIPMFNSNGVGAALMLSSVAACIVTYASTRNEFVARLPRKMLITSICMGGGLVLLAEILRKAMGENGSLAATVAQLFAVGVVFLFFQYILLRPFVGGNRTHE